MWVRRGLGERSCVGECAEVTACRGQGHTAWSAKMQPPRGWRGWRGWRGSPRPVCARVEEGRSSREQVRRVSSPQPRRGPNSRMPAQGPDRRTHLSTENESTATPSLVENTDALPMFTPSSERRAVIRPRLPRLSAKTSQMVACVPPPSAAQERWTLVTPTGSCAFAASSRACCTLSVSDVANAYWDGIRCNSCCTPGWPLSMEEEEADSPVMDGIDRLFAPILGGSAIAAGGCTGAGSSEESGSPRVVSGIGRSGRHAGFPWPSRLAIPMARRPELLQSHLMRIFRPYLVPAAPAGSLPQATCAAQRDALLDCYTSVHRHSGLRVYEPSDLTWLCARPVGARGPVVVRWSHRSLV